MKINWNNVFQELTGKWCWMTYVALVGNICFCIVALSQFIKCKKTHNTTSITIAFSILLPITNSMLFIYNVALFLFYLFGGQFAVSLLPNFIFNGLFSAYSTMAMKIKHTRAAKKLNMNNIDYYNTYLLPDLKNAKNKKIKHQIIKLWKKDAKNKFNSSN